MSCINKAPVISNMVKSQSAAGLSVTAAYGEVIMYSNAAFYNLLRGNAFTAYGETMMLVFQTLIIVALVFWFRRTGGDKIGVGQMGFALGGYLVYLFVVFRGKMSTQSLFPYTPINMMFLLINSADTRHTIHSNGIQSCGLINKPRLSNHSQPQTKTNWRSISGHNRLKSGWNISPNSHNNQRSGMGLPHFACIRCQCYVECNSASAANCLQGEYGKILKGGKG